MILGELARVLARAGLSRFSMEAHTSALLQWKRVQRAFSGQMEDACSEDPERR
jgi:hypothetical protein